MAIAVVQSASNSINSATGFTAVFGSAVTAGNTIVALVAENTALNTPTQTGGTFSQVLPFDARGNSIKQGIFVSTTTGTSATINYTPTNGTGAALIVSEVSGLTGFVTSDGINYGSNTAGTPVATGTVTTTKANDLIIGAAVAIQSASGTTFTNLSAPWTTIVNHSSSSTTWAYYGFYQVVSVTGSYSASITDTDPGAVLIMPMIGAVTSGTIIRSLGSAGVGR